MPENFEQNSSQGILNKKIIIQVVKVIITAVLIFYLVSIIEYEKIKVALKNANYIFILLAFFLTFVNIFLQYKKWQLVCRHLLKGIENKNIFKSLLTGFSGGIITPYRLGEFISRAIPLKNVSLLEVTFATAIDKLFPLIVMSFIGGISTILFIHLYFHVPIYITLSLLLGLIVLYYLVYLLIKNKKFWHKIFYDKLSRVKILEKYISKFKLLGSLSPKVAWQLTILSFFHYLTFTTQMALLFAAFLHQFDFLIYLWISTLVMFSQTIIPQITIADLGIREGSAAFFMNLAGLSAAAGFNAALLLFFINLLLPSIAGAFLIITKNYE